MIDQTRTDSNGSAGNGYAVITAPDSLRMERLLPGPIERVWSYLTDADKRGRWLAYGDMDLCIGGQVRHVFRNSELTDNDEAPPPKYAQQAGEVSLMGRITACEPPRLLAYTWGGTDEDSEVTFELSERADKVLLVLTHRRIGTREDMLSTSAGWHTHLGILSDRLNGRNPSGFWATHTRLEAEYETRIASSVASGEPADIA